MGEIIRVTYDLVDEVKNLRKAQREYEKTNDREILQICNTIGLRIDNLVNRFEELDNQ